MRVLGQHDRRFGVMRQIVQGRNQRPAVHLGLVDLLYPVVKPGGVAQSNRIGSGEQPERRMRRDNLVLVHQGQFAVMFQHPLDHEHNIGTARIIFVKHNRNRVAQRPWQNAFVKFRDLLAVLQFDRVFTDQINSADMAVKVHPHGGPVQTRADLFDMRRFAGAMIALDHHPPVMRKPGQDRHRSVRVKNIGRVNFRHTVAALAKAINFHIGVDPEKVADRKPLGWFCDLFHFAVCHCYFPKIFGPRRGHVPALV